MTDDGSQPPIKQPATAVHHTRVVFLAAAFAVGRGCNSVCVLCIRSAAHSTVRVWCVLGAKKHKNIGNRRTVGVLLLFSNGAYISVRSYLGPVTHSSEYR